MHAYSSRRNSSCRFERNREQYNCSNLCLAHLYIQTHFFKKKPIQASLSALACVIARNCALLLRSRIWEINLHHATILYLWARNPVELILLHVHGPALDSVRWQYFKVRIKVTLVMLLWQWCTLKVLCFLCYSRFWIQLTTAVLRPRLWQPTRLVPCMITI